MFSKGVGKYAFAISGVLAGILTGYGGYLDFTQGLKKLDKKDLSPAERREGRAFKMVRNRRNNSRNNNNNIRSCASTGSGDEDSKCNGNHIRRNE